MWITEGRRKDVRMEIKRRGMKGREGGGKEEDRLEESKTRGTGKRKERRKEEGR